MFAVTFASALLQAQEKIPAVATDPLPAGKKVVTCGHSFHVWVAPMLREMAGMAGISGHEIVAVSSIGGSTLTMHWERPADQNVAKKSLIAGKVDVLTLAPIWLPDPGIEKFAKLAVQHNPKTRVLVQEFWLPNDTYNPVYPLETRKIVDHNAATIPELEKQNDLYCADIEKHVREINQALGENFVFVVPVGKASIRLREKIIQGKAPRLRVQWRLFTDNWGHPTAPLKVLSAYCHYAVLYQRSPVGLPMPSELLRNAEFADPKLNRLLQEIAWEAVTSSPMTGLESLGESGRLAFSGCLLRKISQTDRSTTRDAALPPDSSRRLGGRGRFQRRLQSKPRSKKRP